MFKKLHAELSKIDWKYHALKKLEGDFIELKALSLDPEGVLEVMRVKEIADQLLFHTNWDGHDIKIMRRGN
ncbi:MAG: hypothetical protein P8Y65_07930 [Campylobacterales bacterium]|jgi:predicted transcriptional regulator